MYYLIGFYLVALAADTRHAVGRIRTDNAAPRDRAAPRDLAASRDITVEGDVTVAGSNVFDPGHLFGHVQDADHIEVSTKVVPSGKIMLPQPLRWTSHCGRAKRASCRSTRSTFLSPSS